jgi:hypothetical protein
MRASSGWGIGLAALLASAAASAEPPDGVNADAVPGVFRVAGAADSSPGLSLALNAGYGFTEDVLQLSDAHHRVRGGLAASYRPIAALGFGVRLDGRYDRHTADMVEDDDGYTGELRVFAHAGRSLSPGFGAGLQVGAWIPGLEGVSAEARGIASLTAGPALVHINAGFRLDRSAETIDEADQLSRADRLALGVSDSHAVLLGAGASIATGPIDLLIEGTWDLLVGSDAPPVIESPLRAAAGIAVPINDSYRLVAMLEGSYGRAPLIDAMRPLVPVEPLVGFTLALTQQPGGGEARLITDPVVDRPGPVEPRTRLGGLRGTVRAPDGSPIKGALIRLGSSELLTDASGQFAVDQIEPGEYEVEASGSGYGSVVEKVSIDNDRVLQINIILGQIEVAILRGVIQSYLGDPLVARVVITPGDKEVTSGPDGTFQVELGSGTYTLAISADGYKPRESSVTVEAGGPVTILNIDLQRK